MGHMVLGWRGKPAHGPEWGGGQLRDPPLNELLHHFHPRVELVQGKDVLLSKQPQSRALPKVLQREQRVGVGTRDRGAQEARCGSGTHRGEPS